MTSIDQIKGLKRELIAGYSVENDFRGWFQSLSLLALLALLWVLALRANHWSHWTLLLSIPVISLFLVRVFALMHECGHLSLFRSRWPNRFMGFVFGVISGMPQYVWSRHHNYHHATNGNWEKYRGPVGTLSVREFAALSPARQKKYQRERHPAMAPAGGFLYLVFNPRYTWLKGTCQLWWHLLSGRMRGRAGNGERAPFQTRYWDSRREYWHMCANNVVLLGAATALCMAIGVAPFLLIWLASTSLAGGAGLVLFMVQHNFEHAHATNTERWDYDVGAIRGTSYLVLPRWLDWFTANIGYHHVHHLSASIPNYRLVACHRKYAALFDEVPRVSFKGLPRALACILWDEEAERIISIAEYRASGAQPG